MEFVTDRLTIVVPLGLRQKTEKLPPYQIRRLCMFLIHLAGNNIELLRFDYQEHTIAAGLDAAALTPINAFNIHRDSHHCLVNIKNHLTW